MRNMLGLVVSREEFEHNLTKAAQTGLMEKLAPRSWNRSGWGKLCWNGGWP